MSLWRQSCERYTQEGSEKKQKNNDPRVMLYTRIFDQRREKVVGDQRISFFPALLLVLLLGPLSTVIAADADALDEMAKQAGAYGASLAGDGGADYSPAERETLRAAAAVLAVRAHCAEALQLAKRVVSGSDGAGFSDWSRLATAAYCAKSWHDAVNAAYLGFSNSENDHQRSQALMLLGRSVEAHWRYGTREALAVYRLALEYGELDFARQSVERLARTLREEQGLRVERHFVQLDGILPAICLDFSVGMPEPQQQSYRDYIRFDPDFPALFRKQASDQVCAEGAEFGTDYKVRILPGLAGVEGAELLGTLMREVQVGDRESTLWFGNSRYVLPPGGGVPLHAINLERAALTLYRIGDRNLLHQAVREGFRSDIGRYQAKRIRDELGELVWQGEAELTLRRNREAVTNLPLASLMQPEPGVYVLTAEPADGDGKEKKHGNLAAQWLLVSDIGLTTYRGADGLTVVTRGLADAEPLGGVRLALYARNNRLLAEAVSDTEGVTRFAATALDGKGGREPHILMAFGAGDDFNFFDISAGPFDLSDRGVKGRSVPGPLDAFLYTERGVYRPGEQVHLSVLLRDDRGRAVDGLPLTLRLLRPDEQVAAERVIHPQGAGGYTLELPLSATARTGRWKLLAYLDRDADPLGQTAFLVEAIVPPRIELEVSELPEEPLRMNTRGSFGIQARYLFGAPAAELAASAEMRIAADPGPFPELPGYRFGPVDEPDDSVVTALEKGRTDAAGAARFPFHLQRLPKLNRPLRVRLQAQVADVDGRSVSVSQWLPLRHQPLLIGVKPPGEEGSLQEGSEAVFEVRVLEPDGSPRAHPGLSYRLVEEQSHYQWYRDQGRWQYKRQVRDRVLREEKLTVAAAGPARIAATLEYGSYRLEVQDPESGVRTSVRVHAGWQGGGPDTETPDMLTLRSGRAAYRPGETARLYLRSPFTGPANLVLATDRVLSVQAIVLSESEQVLEVPVDAAWGAGAYALVTAYRPDGGRVGHGPRRAVGVAWLGLDPRIKRLDVAIETIEKTRPERTLEVGLQVAGGAPDEPLFVTLAAVDEGVLRLTDFRTPDPLDHYFGQRRLGVELRDLYGRLIDGHAGTPGRLRSGGGASGRRGTPESHVEIVSLFSGVVALDGDGRGRVPLELPQFNGRLRLTAVAWSPQKLGSAESAVTVRDSVVLMPSGPRFLAVGDRSRATLLLHNLEGPEGEYRLSWQTTGAISIGDEAIAELPLTLAPGQREVVEIPLEASAVGNGSLAVQLQGPDGATVSRELEIGVRAPFLPEMRRRFGRLPPGEQRALGPDLVDNLRPETVSGLLNVSAEPDLDVPGLLQQLDLYPYGCLEQVTSRAFPLLHLERLAQRWDYQSKTPVGERLADAVARILERQLDNGAFALWRPDGEPEPWLSVYALDFLQRARAAGVAVPDFAWERGLGWLRRQVTYPETGDAEAMAVQVYALYLLARHGEAHGETARYLLDQAGERLPSGIAAAHLGATLSLMGDAERAPRAFALAHDKARDAGLRDYGSRLRDLAALLFIQAEIEADGLDPALLVQELARGMGERQWLSTQEQAWLVRAVSAVTGEGTPLRLSVQGRTLPEREQPILLRPDADALARGVELRNDGREAVWYSLAVEGSPATEPAPLQAGFRIRRTLHHLNGAAVDPQGLRQGDLLVVLLEGEAQSKGLNHQALIVDPLPAGLEVENARLAHARTTEGLEWLGQLSNTLYSEALDDRFVAALDLGSDQRKFRLAYLARAVTPGRYRAPPTEVEDMYKPRYRGRGESGWLSVVPMQ